MHFVLCQIFSDKSFKTETIILPTPVTKKHLNCKKSLDKKKTVAIANKNKTWTKRMNFMTHYDSAHSNRISSSSTLPPTSS